MCPTLPHSPPPSFPSSSLLYFNIIPTAHSPFFYFYSISISASTSTSISLSTFPAHSASSTALPCPSRETQSFLHYFPSTPTFPAHTNLYFALAGGSPSLYLPIPSKHPSISPSPHLLHRTPYPLYHLRSPPGS